MQSCTRLRELELDGGPGRRLRITPQAAMPPRLTRLVLAGERSEVLPPQVGAGSEESFSLFLLVCFLLAHEGRFASGRFQRTLALQAAWPCSVRAVPSSCSTARRVQHCLALPPPPFTVGFLLSAPLSAGRAAHRSALADPGQRPPHRRRPGAALPADLPGEPGHRGLQLAAACRRAGCAALPQSAAAAMVLPTWGGAGA